MLLVAIALFVIAPQTIRAQLSADTTAMIDEVFASFDRSDCPGCTVGIDRGGSQIFRRAYGMASLEFGVPLSEQSVLESGSLAKQFTAGAICDLALQGKLGLDDPIRKYVPELHDFGAPVTIRMALNHTSGLRDIWILFWLTGIDQGHHLYTMEQAFAMIYRQRELNFAPGSAYLYSGSGYLLLAKVVERVSGMSLAQYSQETFFKPLGMLHTQWRDDWNRVVPGRVTAYARTDQGEFRMEMPFMSIYGSGGLLTTVGDLLRWNEQLTHPTIFGQTWADLMQRRGRLTDGKEINYASGVIVKEYRGEPEISHNGSSGGYETFLARWPARQLSVVVMCNLAGTNATALGRQVADVFMGPAGTPNSPAAAAATPDTAELSEPAPAAELVGLSGTYYSPELDVYHRCTVIDGRLTVQFGERAPIVLHRVKKDEYIATLMNLQLKFTRGEQGMADGFVLSARRVRNIRFVRR
jgi:CubicO group peptidase (beta-lactamase class C family)